MKPAFFPVILGGARIPFTPARLFSSGVQGAWYDPSDYSSLFQDSAGTTPVTAVEQPVGLMLDKSQGLVLGSELVANWATQASWSVGIAGAVFSGTTIEFDAINDRCTRPSPFTSGRTYLVTFTIVVTSGAAFTLDDDGVGGGAGSLTQYFQQSATGSYSFYLRATSSTRLRLIQSLAGTISLTSFSAKEIAGNHASQATSASRPVLRARYNLLTYSEQFDNAAWTKTATTVSANQTTAPDGTTTADTLTESGTAGEHYINQQTTKVGASIRYTYRVAFKNASGTRNFAISLTDGTTGGYGAIFSTSGTVVSSSFVIGSVSGWTFHSSDVVADANGFYVATLSVTTNTATRLDAVCYLVNGTTTSYTGNGTSAIYIWGADLRTGSSAGTYQRIAAATDYATAGFLPYLYFVTDDSMATGSIDFTATDKMSVCTGVTKLGDTATGTIASTNSSGLPGYFEFFAPSSTATNDFAFRSIGTLSSQATSAGSYAAPITCVLTGRGDISGDSSTLRLNGSQIASNSADQGTGNYGSYPLQIGRRGGFSLPFNGNIYQLIVCGKTLSASELASTESYVATKTGVVI